MLLKLLGLILAATALGVLTGRCPGLAWVLVPAVFGCGLAFDVVLRGSRSQEVKAPAASRGRPPRR